MNAQTLFYISDTLTARRKTGEALTLAEMESLSRAIRAIAELVDEMERQPIPPEKLVDLRRALTVIDGGKEPLAFRMGGGL